MFVLNSVDMVWNFVQRHRACITWFAGKLGVFNYFGLLVSFPSSVLFNLCPYDYHMY